MDISEQPVVAKATNIRATLQDIQNALDYLFTNNTFYKYPRYESDDGKELSSKNLNEETNEFEVKSVTELCLLATEIFSERPNSGGTLIEPSLAEGTSLAANAFNIRNKVQYCNNLLRDCLKRRGILSAQSDLNSLSELVALLDQIEPLDSTKRVFTLNKDTFYPDEEIILIQKNIIGQKRSYAGNYYDDEYYNTNYDVDNIDLDSKTPIRLRFDRTNGYSLNSDGIFDKNIGYHKKLIEDYFRNRYYVSYRIKPPINIIQRVELDENGDLDVYFMSKHQISNTTILTDLNLNNDGDIEPTNNTFLTESDLGAYGINNIALGEDDDIIFIGYVGEIGSLVDSISLTTDKNILSSHHSEYAILSATVLDNGGNPSSDITVEFFKDSTSLGTSTTNNNGIATKMYTATGEGDVLITAKAEEVTSNTVTIEDCIVYDNATTDKSNTYNIIDYSNVPYSLTHDPNNNHYVFYRAGKPDKFTIIEFGNTEAQEVYFECDWNPYSFVVSNGYNAIFDIRDMNNVVDGANGNGIQWGTWSSQKFIRYFKNSSGITRTQNGTVSSNVWYRMKATIKNGEISAQIYNLNNDSLVHSQTWIDTISVNIYYALFGVFIGNNSTTSYLKNIKFKVL